MNRAYCKTRKNTFTLFPGTACCNISRHGRVTDTQQTVQYCSGKRPGIQRDASLAGNARRSGAHVLLETMTPRLVKATVTRLAWRSLAPSSCGTSPRGSSPR